MRPAGNLRYNLSNPTDLDDASFVDRADDLARTVYDRVSALGQHRRRARDRRRKAGRCTHKDLAELDLMRTVKDALDPQGLLNPGKVL